MQRTPDVTGDTAACPKSVRTFDIKTRTPGQYKALEQDAYICKLSA